MKMKLLFTLIGLGLCTTLTGQIKIGDNPQNIDAASVLELESTDRVLVISRMSAAQMNALAPLAGALVYNTDEGCIYYFNGSDWLNLCDSLGLTITADPVVNETGTIVITENGDNVNLEVGQIGSENILNFSINSIDLQNNSITADKLAPDSVGSEELQENTVTDDEIDYNQVTLNDFINDSGYITGADIVSGSPNNAITDNGGAFYDDDPLQASVAANAAAIAADGDTNSANEIQNLSLAGNQLSISGGNNVDLSPFNNTGSDNQNLIGATLNGSNILQIDIENGASTAVDLSPLSGTGTDDQQITDFSLDQATDVLSITIEGGNTQTIDLSQRINSSMIVDGTVSSADLGNNAVETSKIEDLAVTEAKIAPGNADQILRTDPTGSFVSWVDLTAGATQNLAQVLAVGSSAGNERITDLLDPLQPQDAATRAYVDAAGGGGEIPDNELITNFELAGNTLTITEAGTDFPVDLSGLGGGTTELADQVTIVGDGSTGDEFTVADGAINAAKIANNAVQSAHLANNAVTTAKIQDGQVQTADIADLNVTEAKLSPGNADQILRTDPGGTFVQWVDLPAAGNPAAADVSFTPTGNTVADDVQEAIEELQTEINGLSAGGAANPNDELITSFNLTGTELNIAEGATIQPPVDLNPTFATDAELAAAIGGLAPVVSADLPNSITSGSDGGALYADGDSDDQNEIQDLTAVLAQGTDANNNIISNLADPAAAQDAATMGYVDAQILASNQVVVSTDVPNSITAGSDGGALYNDPDNNASNEIQNLSQVLGIGSDANATVISNLANPV
ncbi:MAG TPA: hypothetical protein VKN36_03365, partial [Eudoraea sp.]|nr:hypothetical protein [Eudoraea sp.]